MGSGCVSTVSARETAAHFSRRGRQGGHLISITSTMMMNSIFFFFCFFLLLLSYKSTINTIISTITIVMNFSGLQDARGRQGGHLDRTSLCVCYTFVKFQCLVSFNSCSDLLNCIFVITCIYTCMYVCMFSN